MPKVILSRQAETIETVRRNIESRLAYFGLRTDREVGARLCMPRSSYALRRTNPGGWTLEQIVRLCETLKCTPQWLFADHSKVQGKEEEI